MDVNNNLTVISWNVRSLTSDRVADVHYYITQHSTDIILLQENGDRNRGAIKLKGYIGYHLPASKGVRSVSTYIKKSIPSEPPGFPGKRDGSVCAKIHVRECVVNVINLCQQRLLRSHRSS